MSRGLNHDGSYTWRVSLLKFPEIARLLADAQWASRNGDKVQAAELAERIKRFPGFPMGAPPGAKFTIIPIEQTAVVWVSQPTKGDQP